MKQEFKFRDDQKASSPAAAAAAAAAASRSSRAVRGRRESQRSDSANASSPILRTRPKPPPPSDPPTAATRIRSSTTSTTAAAAAAIHANKMRPSNDHHDHRPAAAAAGRIAEQFAHLRRPEAKELQRRRLEESEKVVTELRGEVSALRAQLQSLQGANSQLQFDNKRFADDLLAAQRRIQQLEMLNLNSQDTTKFAAADKLEQLKVEDDTDTDADTDTGKTQLTQLPQRVQLPELAKPKDLNAKSSPTPPPPPPPPPPLSRQAPPSKSNSVNKATALVELYNSLTKRDGKGSKGSGSYSNSVGANPHHSIVGELQNRSGHLLAIKADVKTKGEFIRHLIDRVRSAAYTSMDDVLAFVDWLDRELSTLSDERAVLKHFEWPERKADALREAAFEYRDLKRVEAEAASFSDDPSSPCEATLKKISNLLEKLEKSMSRLVKLRNSSTLSYKECKIPTEWMLDSGIVSTMKLASMKLAKVYMKRVVTELDTNRSPERETAQEALLFQSVRFAYRAHQFAGGLDSETMRAFEQLREKIRSNGRGSKVLIPGMVLS